MKTSPNISDLRPTEAPSSTEISKDLASPAIKATEKLSFLQFAKGKLREEEGQIMSLDCTEEFSFEKERIRALEHSQLFQSLNTSQANQESVLTTTKIAELVRNNLALRQKLNADKQAKDFVGKILKVLSIVLALFSTANVIAAFFGILFLSISSMPIGNFMVWISAEIFVTICFLCLSLKGSGAAQFSLVSLSAYLKRVLVLFGALVGFFVALCAQKTPRGAFECALGWNDPELTSKQSCEAMFCIVLICLTFSTLYKLLVVAVYISLAILLRRKLVSLEGGERLAGESQRQPLELQVASNRQPSPTAATSAPAQMPKS